MPLSRVPPTGWTLRPATDADLEPLAALRAEVLRADLTRLGRYDPVRVRQRLRDAYRPADTRIIVVDGARAGCIALRPDGDTAWLEHFYLAAGLQGAGIGSAVLASVLAGCDAARRRVRLTVLRGSPAGRLYARHGFTVESDEDPVDVLMVREPRNDR